MHTRQPPLFKSRSILATPREATHADTDTDTGTVAFDVESASSMPQGQRDHGAKHHRTIPAYAAVSEAVTCHLDLTKWSRRARLAIPGSHIKAPDSKVPSIGSWLPLSLILPPKKQKPLANDERHGKLKDCLSAALGRCTVDMSVSDWRPCHTLWFAVADSNAVLGPPTTLDTCRQSDAVQCLSRLVLSMEKI